MTTMTAKQQQQQEEVVKTSLATERVARCQRDRQARWRTLTQHFFVLLLFIKLNNYFILFDIITSLQIPIALSVSAIPRCCPPPTPSLTAIALCPPPPSPNARACLCLSRKLERVDLYPSLTPLRCFFCPHVGGIKATVASSLIVVFLHLVVSLPHALPPPALLHQNGCHHHSCTLSNGWLLSVLSLVHHLASPLRSIMQSQSWAILNCTWGRAVSTPPSTLILQRVRDVLKPCPADATAPPSSTLVIAGYAQCLIAPEDNHPPSSNFNPALLCSPTSAFRNLVPASRDAKTPSNCTGGWEQVAFFCAENKAAF
jgi:hypothetical protein